VDAGGAATFLAAATTWLCTVGVRVAVTVGDGDGAGVFVAVAVGGTAATCTGVGSVVGVDVLGTVVGVQVWVGVGTITVGVDVGTMVGVLVGVGVGDGWALQPVLKSALNSASPTSSRDKTMRMMNDRFKLALLHTRWRGAYRKSIDLSNQGPWPAHLPMGATCLSSTLALPF
jgi:hypothetical protein